MESSWFIKKMYDIATHHFHKWYGLVATIFLLGVISLSVYRLVPDGKIAFRTFAIEIIVLEIFVFAGWALHVWHFPKRSRKKLGVTIAVQVEDLEDLKYFKKDFLSPFKNKICSLNLPFDVLELKNHQAEKIETDDDARKILWKTRAQFCIWGSIKKRKKTPVGEKYLFSLHGVVVHKPIQEVQKVLLRKEFDALLPNTVIFEENLQFEGFDFRANQAITALDYITGRAALLSGDFSTAIRLHESLFNAIQNGQSFPINKGALKNLLSLEYDQKASFEYHTSSSEGDYAKSVDKSLNYNPNNYGALLKKAIIEFNNSAGNAKAALNTIDLAKKYAKGGYHWLYSNAFLNFWLGRYDDAIQTCEKLKNKSYYGEKITIQEVVIFNENLLKKYNKPVLYYWLGFIYYVKAKNLASADINFQKFVQHADNSMQSLKIKAESYLAEIKKEIGYK
ncbi:MAG: hypothetical protein WC477_00410 [Patescibacteria group bacterium]